MSTLGVDVFVADPKPVPSQVPPFDATGQQATWPPTTSTLVHGEHDALLVDTLITVEEAQKLAAWVRARGKNLRAVYITHPHADHLFGLGTILASFPGASGMTLADISPFMAGQVTPGFRAVWEGFFPGQIAADIPLPEPVDGETFELEGRPVKFVGVGTSDTEHCSVVHIPDAGTVVAGDVVYNDVHMWLWGSTPDSRQAWLRALEEMERLQPGTIIAGHRSPAAADDDASRLLDASRAYLADFESAATAAGSAQDIINTMMARHGNRDNPYTLWVAAFDVMGRAGAV
ncbi:MAG TPA: MBL fold metallo-hydrolase [Streptosporangiaceae bacterium]|jgi:glyoxylase-like metal-dependent hydrolase (beta-lactamase superfamily II)